MYCIFIRLFGEFWEMYDLLEMKLNLDLIENIVNRKEVNFKRIKYMDEEEWKSFDMVLEVNVVLDFIEYSSMGVEFFFLISFLEM